MPTTRLSPPGSATVFEDYVEDVWLRAFDPCRRAERSLFITRWKAVVFTVDFDYLNLADGIRYFP
jgi:hypothetical protein